MVRQFNLSGVVFVQRACHQSAVQKLRISTLDHELSFAGHSTIDAAFV
ncbi:MAG: PhzF family phenazine biosynthesis protein [Pasteurella oralis]|nr:PhzF family phenazine biosynthesis protein [Pasteurella oralis]MDO5055047.1 PhzF family phenazine biosynthesis protein [Pasteurella oralis]